MNAHHQCLNKIRKVADNAYGVTDPITMRFKNFPMS